MHLIEVLTPFHRSQFFNFSFDIYKSDENWVCPLQNDIESVFDPKKNKYTKKVDLESASVPVGSFLMNRVRQ